MSKKDKKKYTYVIAWCITILSILAVMVVGVVVMSISAYYSNTSSDVEILASNYSSLYSEVADKYLDELLKNVQSVANNAKDATTDMDFNRVLKRAEDNPGASVLQVFRYFKNGVFFESQGLEAVGEEKADEQILEFYEERRNGSTGVISPVSGGTGVALCLCVDDNARFDMLVGYVKTEDFVKGISDKFATLVNLPKFYETMVLDNSGKIIGYFKQHVTEGEENKTVNYTYELDTANKLGGMKITNVFDTLSVHTHNKVNKTVIEENLANGKTISSYITVSSISYVISVTSPRTSSGNLLFSQIYLPENIAFMQYSFISLIITSILCLLGIVIVLVVLSLSYRNSWAKRLQNTENFEPLTGCNTYKMFKEQVTILLEHNRSTKYAIIYVSLTQFDILYENYGDNVTTEIITFCGKIITKSIDSNETYGHISDGKFVIALHFRDFVDLDNRIDVIYALINNFNKFNKVEYTLTFTAGVYPVKRNKTIDPELMLSNAIVAQKSVGVTHAKYYCLYDEKLDEARQLEREIELRKEQALKNKEFLVYYQPKLNLTSGTIDGAEALVRWYYPETDTVYSPAKFLPIFEMDGFVEKLDRYVYLETLAFMKRTLGAGRKVCPISVNVSRFTALQSGFLEFYIENKKKYGIADGYLYIEFTESFAYDNNDRLREIVNELRKNGIKCSIDDFGVGYSSYSVLKELPMDEIKLDSFFMKPGYNADHDEKTIKSVINLGKDLGLKVTQEGVETEEEKQKLISIGCDVLQGYCYSKPLPEKKFEEFLEQSLGIYGKRKNEEY